MQLNRGTLGLLVLSLIVVIAVGLFQQPLLSVLTPPTPTLEIKQLLPFGIAQQATTLTIRHETDFTSLERIDGLWEVVSGTTKEDLRETNHDLIDGILQIMADIEYESKFESDDFAQFGLAESTSKVEITMGDEQIQIILGNTNPDGDNLYLRLNDVPTIYLVPAVFEFANIMRLASEPPYRDVTAQDENLPGNLLFPDVFGYQIQEFRIQDMRDNRVIIYRQGEQGTWILDGTVVNPNREIDHSQAAVNVSQFLFLEVEPLAQSVRESLTDVAILTLSMTTEDSRAYTMTVYPVEDIGYAGRLDDGKTTKLYALPNHTVNLFFDMVVQPPYETP